MAGQQIKGYELYKSKIDNIKGMLNKISEIINIDSYQYILDEIKRDVRNDDFNATKKGMPFDGMQSSYEFYSLSPYIERLDALEDKIKKEVQPFYNTYLSTKNINNDINNVNQKTIEEIIKRTIDLINQLNLLEPHDYKKYNEIIDEAYKAIYSVMIKEASFKRSDVFDYIKRINKDADRERLSLILNADLRLIPEKIIIKEELDNMKSEGLSFDLLTKEIIEQIARAKEKEKKDPVRSRLVFARKLRKETDNQIQSDKEYIDYSAQIRDLKRSRLTSSLKLSTLIMIPIVALGISYHVGRKKSDGVFLYRNSIRTVDCNSGRVISEEREWYGEDKNTFTATLLINGPWEKRIYGKGYSRDVVAYEYDENDEINIENASSTRKEKYRYTEYSDSIPEGENTEDATVYITSEYQDQTDYKKSNKYVIPSIILGLLLAGGLDFLLVYLKIIEPYKLSGDRLRKLRIIEDLNVKRNAIADQYEEDAGLKKNKIFKTKR